MKKTLSFYTVFFIFCTVIMRLSGLFSKIILAKSITPYEYGIITLVVMSLPILLQIVSNIFFHDLLSHSKNGQKYFGFSMLYTSSVIVLLALVFLVFHNEIFGFLNLPLDNWIYLLFALFIALVANAFLVNVMGILRGYKKYSLVSLMTTAPSVLRAILIAIYVYFFGLSDFNQILLLFAVPSLLVILSVFIKEHKRLIRRINSVDIPSKDMFFFGMSVFLVSSFINITQNISRVVISHMLGVETQGYFDVSLSLLTIMTFSFGAMQFISVPEATGTKNRDEILLKKGGLGDVSRALFAFLVYCVLLLYFYSEDLVNLLFSEDYSVGSQYVYILAIGNVFLYMQQFLALLNISMTDNLRESKNLLLATFGMLVLLPGITHFMILEFGFLGAYLSLSLYFILYTLLTIVYSKDRDPLKILFIKCDGLLISAVLTFMLLLFLEPSFFMGLFGSLFVYFLLVFSLGYLRKDLLFDVFPKRFRKDSSAS